MSATATARHEMHPRSAAAGVRLHALLAEFSDPHALKAAAARVRDAGFTRWDCHSPFPVHGLDPAMGIQMTKLPLVVFVGGLAGCLTAILLQWWANATNFADARWVPTFLQGYNFQVSGKPYWSFPANIPIIFELTVLFSALTAGIGMLIANNLPLFNNPLFNSRRFARATSDGFFLRIDADDPKFHLQQTEGLLSSLGAVAVERVEEFPPAPGEERLPAPFIKAGIVLSCVALIPLSIIWMARNQTSTEPRIHLIQDMDNQEKYKAQSANPLFADGRAMRPPVRGAIARGDLRQDDHYYRGYKVGTEIDPATNEPLPIFFTTFPKQVKLDDQFIHRGQQRFNVYCAPCHGQDGSGNGMVNIRALELGGTWVAAGNLLDDDRRSRPVGKIFETISNGIRTMPRYGDQVPEMDRWAIVAYVKALQKTVAASINDLPERDRTELLKR